MTIAAWVDVVSIGLCLALTEALNRTIAADIKLGSPLSVGPLIRWLLVGWTVFLAYHLGVNT